MGLHEIQRLASALGIKGASRMKVDTLIRCVQYQEGHMPCFSEVWSAPCSIGECPFFDVCSSSMATRVTARH